MAGLPVYCWIWPIQVWYHLYIHDTTLIPAIAVSKAIAKFLWFAWWVSPSCVRRPRTARLSMNWAISCMRWAVSWLGSTWFKSLPTLLGSRWLKLSCCPLIWLSGTVMLRHMLHLHVLTVSNILQWWDILSIHLPFIWDDIFTWYKVQCYDTLSLKVAVLLHSLYLLKTPALINYVWWTEKHWLPSFSFGTI